ncbi:MAG: DoxX family protein [Terracidiphilus sp.]
MADPQGAPPFRESTIASFRGILYRPCFHTILLRRALQRLFSTFPSNWPGAGLLLLRLTAGMPMIVGGIAELRGAAESVTIALAVAAVVSGVFLVIGLWTPVAAMMGTFLQLWLVLSRTGYDGKPILLAGLTASLAMLGPGAWSIDGRLFGRKRIEFPE